MNSVSRYEPPLGIAPDGTHFVRDGKPLASPSEWRHYLAVRRQQGFTGILVSV